MIKAAILTFILGLIWGLSSAQAYIFKEENKPISSKKALSDAAKIGLRPSNDEVLAMQEIRSWPDRTKKDHLNTGAPEPLLLEAQKNDKNLTQAKVIARQQVFRAVEKHWNRLKDSSLNEPAVDTFAKFEPYLKRQLEKIEYSGINDPKGYLFTLPWADVRVTKNLKKVSWVIRIASHLDGNRLQEGAEKIVVPERSAE